MTKFEIIQHLVRRCIEGYTMNDSQYNEIKEHLLHLRAIKLNDGTKLTDIYKEPLGKYNYITGGLYRDLAITLYKRTYHKIPSIDQIFQYI